MIKKILSDYRYHLKENGKDFTNSWMLYYWLYIYEMIMSNHMEKGLLVTVSMAFLILLIACIAGFCPIKPEKTMYLCPISQRGHEKYLHAQYLLKTIFCSIILFFAAFLFGYFRLPYGEVWVISVWLFILLLNTRVSQVFYNNRKAVSDVKYRILKVLAWIFELCAYWWYDGVWKFQTNKGTLNISVGALFLIPSFICTGITIFFFWTTICQRMGNYEMVYQDIQEREDI